MSKSVFISFVHEDKPFLEKIQKWEQQKLLGALTITCEVEDKRHEGEIVIRKYLQKKIEGASAILVLVGNNTHNHDWIRAEVELANSYNKKLICVRIPGTTGSVPLILKNYKEITFEPQSILREI